MQSPQSVPCWSSWSAEPSRNCRCRPLLLSLPYPTWCRWLWNSLYARLQHYREKHVKKSVLILNAERETNIFDCDLLCFIICSKQWTYWYECILYLQWTTIGPAEGGLEILILRMKESSPVAWYGTPWSGHPVKWNCLTSRTSLKPRWVKATQL